MEVIDDGITVKFSLQERDELATYILHEMDSESMSIEAWDLLRNLGRLLAPDWC